MTHTATIEVCARAQIKKKPPQLDGGILWPSIIATKSESQYDEDSAETTDQGSYASDNEASSSADSRSAQSGRVNSKLVPICKDKSGDLAWLCPTVLARRAELRRRGHGVLDKMNTELPSATHGDCTQKVLTKPRHKLEASASPPSAADVPLPRKFLNSQPAPLKDDDLLSAPLSAEREILGFALEPVKVFCNAKMNEWTMCNSNDLRFNPSLPLKKRPIYKVDVVLQSSSLLPIKKRASSFFFQTPPSVLAC